jgi:hypothetical protein
MNAMLVDCFYHDGRGRRSRRSTIYNLKSFIVATDYFNTDVSHRRGNLKHLLFLRPQVFMFDTEEKLRTKDWARSGKVVWVKPLLFA